MAGVTPFHHIDNAIWHDGQPLTADDVAFSFGYYKDHPFKWMSSDVVKSADVLPTVPSNLLWYMPPPTSWKKLPGSCRSSRGTSGSAVTDPIKFTDASALVGSGPYRVAEHDATAGAYRLTAVDTYSAALRE